jgi:hypothetical protein
MCFVLLFEGSQLFFHGSSRLVDAPVFMEA